MKKIYNQLTGSGDNRAVNDFSLIRPEECNNRTNHRRTIMQLLLAVGLLLACWLKGADAQTPGSLDLTFNTNDIGYGAGQGFNLSDFVYSVAVQPDGKVIVGGSFTQFNGQYCKNLTRLNSDGTIDIAFATAIGSFGFNDQVNTVKLQPDGKILVGGKFTRVYNNSTTCNYIARLNSDGTMDNTFKTNVGTGFDAWVNTIELQPDGKILVGGSFVNYKGVAGRDFVRLNADGTRDATFNLPGTGINGAGVYAIAVLPTGDIVIGGNFGYINSLLRNSLACLNSDGSEDVDFLTSMGGSPTTNNPFNKFSNGGFVYALAVDANGMIVVGGTFTDVKGINYHQYISRIDSSGAEDGTFATNTYRKLDSYVYALAIQPDGKIIVGGRFINFGYPTGPAPDTRRILRLNADGTLDAAYTTGNGTGSDYSLSLGGGSVNVLTLALQSDGKVIAGGEFVRFNGISRTKILRLKTDGVLDDTFAAQTGFNGGVNTVQQQPDGKILVGGSFSLYNGVACGNIARINTDGSIDNTFNSGQVGFRGGTTVNDIALQSDGKIIVTGNLDQYNGVAMHHIIRLNTDGSKDNTFASGTGLNFYGQVLAVQPDDKIIVGGAFNTYNGSAAQGIVRLNADGSYDGTFATGSGTTNNTIYALALQPDGKVIVGGDFTTIMGNARNRIVRLTSAGALDATFNVGSGFNNVVRSLTLQSDKKVIVGGSFASYKVVSCNFIIRLDSVGTTDATFNVGSGFNNPIWQVKLQPDDKIVCVGIFSQFQSTGRKGIARLNDDGTLDNVFNPGTGMGVPAQIPYDIEIQPDGQKAYIGGSFTYYNGIGRNRIARIWVLSGCPKMIGGTASPSYSIICPTTTQSLTCNGSGGTKQWQSSTNNVTWSDIAGANGSSYTTPDGATLGGAGTQVYYRCLIKSAACFDVSSTTAKVAVSQPTISLSVTGKTSSAITLNWSPINGSTNYNISYTGTPSGSNNNVTPPYAISGLNPGNAYDITVTQTGLSCSASGTLTAEKTLCASPANVVVSSGGNRKLKVDWEGAAGNYRVYYRPTFVQTGYQTKDVTTAGTTGSTTINVTYNTSYEAYVVAKDCPSSGVYGQPSALSYGLVGPSSPCTPAPTIHYVKSTCAGQIEVSMSGSPTGNYSVAVQRLTPSVASMNRYTVTGSYFQVNVNSPGQTFLVAVASKCASGVSDYVVYSGGITIKSLCNSISNLVLSHPTCNGFTASWNRDPCTENTVNTYNVFIRRTSPSPQLTWNSYIVTSPNAPISPSKVISWMNKGSDIQCYVRSNYVCNGYIIQGPPSTTQTITTLSIGCREEEDALIQPEEPAAVITSADNTEAISLYPNPNGGQFRIDISRLSNEKAEVRIEVMNVLGQTVLTRISEAKDGFGNEIITLPETVSAGTYFVRVTVGNNVYTTKVSVSK